MPPAENGGSSDPFAEYRALEFMASRIPIQDALVVFVPEGAGLNPVVHATITGHAQSRWYPRPGGHEVLVPYGGEPHDATLFTVRPGAWDHETCTHCRAHIPPMTLCWVTPSGWYVLLCETCYIQFRSTRRPPDVPSVVRKYLSRLLGRKDKAH
jgi:hypothetical protein